MRGSRLFVLGALAFLVVPRLAAQQPIIGSVRLQLGESKEPALKRLEAYYLLTRSRGAVEDLWLVSDTTTWLGTPNYGNVGTVQFALNRLVSAGRSWLPSEAARSDAAAILAAMSSFDGATDCSIAKDASNEPIASFELVRIRCAQHSITIGISTQPAGRFTHVTESWLWSRYARGTSSK